MDSCLVGLQSYLSALILASSLIAVVLWREKPQQDFSLSLAWWALWGRSALIKSCRNIFTTVQRKWGYLVKLVSLHSEDLWGGGRTGDVCPERTVSWFGFSIHTGPGGLCTFPLHQYLRGDFPTPSWQGESNEGTVSCGSCFLCQCSFPLPDTHVRVH